MAWLALIILPLALAAAAALRRRSRLAVLAGLAGAGLLFLLAAGSALFVLVSRYALSCRLSSAAGCERSVTAPWWLAAVGLVMAMGSLYLAESCRRRYLQLGRDAGQGAAPDMSDG